MMLNVMKKSEIHFPYISVVLYDFHLHISFQEPRVKCECLQYCAKLGMRQEILILSSNEKSTSSHCICHLDSDSVVLSQYSKLQIGKQETKAAFESRWKKLRKTNKANRVQKRVLCIVYYIVTYSHVEPENSRQWNKKKTYSTEGNDFCFVSSLFELVYAIFISIRVVIDITLH